MLELPEAGPGPFRRADVDIGFPFDAIGTDLAALMTIAIGGTYSISGFSGIRVVDMKLPKEFRGAHPGPQFGVDGSRRLTGVEGRPIIGTIVKPALGLRPHETAEMVGELIAAGVDFIKDDEKLMSPAYSPLAERVKAIMPIILDHEQKTGRKVMYAFGISHADPDEMMRNHDMVAKAGGNCAVVNINSIGFGGMAFLRKRSSLVLHAHRTGWDILTRHPGLGMDFKVWQQFWRLLGVDQFQINGIQSKYWEPDDSFVLGRGLGTLLRRLTEEQELRRVIIAGGDTSSHALGQMGVDALTVRMPLPASPGSPLCVAHSRVKAIDGLEVALKGGQVGTDRYFSAIREGVGG